MRHSYSSSYNYAAISSCCRISSANHCGCRTLTFGTLEKCGAASSLTTSVRLASASQLRATRRKWQQFFIVCCHFTVIRCQTYVVGDLHNVKRRSMPDFPPWSAVMKGHWRRSRSRCGFLLHLWSWLSVLCWRSLYRKDTHIQLLRSFLPDLRKCTS